MFASEPIADVQAFRELLQWAAEREASDITLRSGRPVKVERYGVLEEVTRRPLTTQAIGLLLHEVYGAHAMGRLQSGSDIDCSYSIQVDRGRHVFFRVNATPVLDGVNLGVEVTLRVLPERPPSMDDIDLEPEIREAAFPATGMVLLAGATGSGKSTTIATIIRHRVETAPEKIVTYEAPIEYRFDSVTGPGLISQSQVPEHLPDFLAGIRNALRRAPDVIVVQEMRDQETLTAGIVAADTGHAVYSTVHGRSVADCFRRMTMLFPTEDRRFYMAAILAVMRLIVVQVLIPSTDGRRVAAREYLQFTPRIVDELMDTPVDEWHLRLREIVEREGRPMAHSIEVLCELGRISVEKRDRWLRRWTSGEGGHVA